MLCVDTLNDTLSLNKLSQIILQYSDVDHGVQWTSVLFGKEHEIIHTELSTSLRLIVSDCLTKYLCLDILG